MVNIVLCVPLDVWKEHVSPFLTLKHFVAVDTALGSLRQRNEYHNRIRSYVGSFIAEPVYFGVALWLQTVGVHPKQIVFDDSLTDDQLNQLLLFGSEADSIHFNYCRRLSCEFIRDFVCNSSQVQDLQLKNCAVSSVMLRTIGETCPGLTSLTLAGDTSLADMESIVCNFPALVTLRLLDNGFQIIDAMQNLPDHQLSQLQYLTLGGGYESVGTLAHFTRHFANLRELSASHCQDCFDSDLLAMADNCPYLQSLTMWEAPNASIDGLSALFTKCRHLHTLKLPNVDTWAHTGFPAALLSGSALLNLDVSEGNVTDTDLQILALNCQQLQKLNVSGCREVSDAGIISIAQHCSDLRELRTWRSPFVQLANYVGILGDASVYAVAAHCSKLECFEITVKPHVTLSSLTALITQCTHMKRLDINAEQEDLSAFVGQVLQTCQKLECFHYHSCTLVKLPSLGVVHNNLRKLSLYNTKMDAQSLLHLAQCCTNLDSLKLDASAMETTGSAETWVQLVCMFGRLTSLCLCACSLLSDATVAKIAQTLGKRLLHLEVSDCYHITDVAVGAIAIHCTRLRTLVLEDLSLLTAASVNVLVERNLDLAYLDIEGCQNVPQSALLPYQHKYPLCSMHVDESLRL